MTKRLR